MWSFSFSWITLHAFLLFHFSNANQLNAIPRSCIDHLRVGAKTNGFYSVAGENGETLSVYCDFESEPGSAWTLVISWSLENKNLPAFQSQPLTENVPVNEKTPNWVAYRLSKANMAILKSKSTHWRATCSFNTVKVDYRDYVRGSFKDLDITTYLGDGVCKKIEYINIRGNVGYQTTVDFWQKKNLYIITIDSSIKGCQFDARPGVVPSEDNFGYYHTINRKFRCSQYSDSTTQYWFGGYL